MVEYSIFEELKRIGDSPPPIIRLPSEEDTIEVEKFLGIEFPQSFREFQLKYSYISGGGREILQTIQDKSYLDIVETTKNIRKNLSVPENFIPFLKTDSAYYCFDTKTHGTEYKVVLWETYYNEVTEEWKNFIDWIEKDWIPLILA